MKYKYVGPDRGDKCLAYGYDFSNGPVECDTFLAKLDSNPEFEIVGNKPSPKEKKKPVDDGLDDLDFDALKVKYEEKLGKPAHVKATENSIKKALRKAK